MEFEWDVRKAKRNLEKHGVAFEEAATVFADTRSLELPDPMHSTKTETRCFRLGMSAYSRVLLIVFTERSSQDGYEVTRIISARPASKRERESYRGADDA